MVNSKVMYTKSHEWVRELDGGIVEVGLSDHAQQELGDLVFVNLPQVGDEAVAGETIADVESVKAVSDIYSPVTGTICEVNEELLDSPEKINEDAYASWLFRVSDVTAKEELLSPSEYEVFIATSEE